MTLPKIDLASLPDLETLTGVFGSMASGRHMPGHDDTIIVLATFIYETVPPGTGGGII